jgi:hypothetical protein
VRRSLKQLLNRLALVLRLVGAASVLLPVVRPAASVLPLVARGSVALVLLPAALCLAVHKGVASVLLLVVLLLLGSDRPLARQLRLIRTVLRPARRKPRLTASLINR